MINFMLCVCYHNSKHNTKKEPSLQMYFSQRPAAGSRKIQKDGLCPFTEPRPAHGAVSKRRIRTGHLPSVPSDPRLRPRTYSEPLARPSHPETRSQQSTALPGTVSNPGSPRLCWDSPPEARGPAPASGNRAPRSTGTLWSMSRP